MTKHYKNFGIWLGLLLLATALILFLRPHFTPTKEERYLKTVVKYAKEYSLDPAFVLAVIRVESNFDPKAVSKADAKGMMQITDETLSWAILREGKNAPHTPEELFDPDVNIKYGCLILSLLTEEFKDTDTVLAAYNAGRGNVLKWLKDSRYSNDGIRLDATPYEETNQYIKKVQKYFSQYKKKLGEAV